MCIKKTLWLLPLLFVAACGRNSGRYPAVSTADTTSSAEQAPAPPSSLSTLKDHKFADTAVFQCKVQDVFKSTTRLEQLVTSLGGIVQESRMSNTASDVKTIDYKEDSLQQVQTYTTSAIIAVRVPRPYLDSVVKAIPGMCTFIDSRSLTQTDVTYHYMANALENNQVDNKQAVAQAHKLARKTEDVIAVQEYENESANEHITQKIDNMQIQDNIDYATINVTFSQPERVFVQAVVNPSFFSRIPFTLRCKAALHNSIDLISGIIIGLVNIWPLLLLIAGIWVVYKKTNRKKMLLANK